MPIACVADYSTTDEIVAVVESAYAKLRQAPQADVFVVLACHQETGAMYCGRIRDALVRVHARDELRRAVSYTTISEAAWRAQHRAAPR